MEDIERSFEFQQYGYVALNSTGFALPIYRSDTLNSNALYIALTEISGDPNSKIVDFEVTTLSPDQELKSPNLVRIGDQFVSVFINKGEPFTGSAHDILARTVKYHQDIMAYSPLSFLDLAIAAKSERAKDALDSAIRFLTEGFDEQYAFDIISEVALRRGVHIAMSSCLAGKGVEVFLPRALSNFSVTLESRRQVLVSLDEGVRLILDEDQRVKFAGKLESFVRLLGLSLHIQGGGFERASMDADARTPDIVRSATATRRRRTRRFGLVREIAIDLGTAYTRIFSDTQGLILSEPSVIAIRAFNGKRTVVAVGAKALEMEGRTPDNIEVIRPIHDGAIADLELASDMIQHFIRAAKHSPSFFRPLDVVVCVPSGSTQMERRTIENAAKSAGASKVFVMLQPMAAAIGADMPVTEPVASLVLNIGGGMTEVAVISMRGVAYTTSVRMGGDKMTEAVIMYFQRHHNLLIGNATAERIKREYGVASPDLANPHLKFNVRGRNLAFGVPSEVEVSQRDLSEAFENIVNAVVEGVQIALEHCAPELAADIIDQGIVMTGGGALLGALDQVIEERTGLPVSVAEDPSSAVARGIGIAMADPLYRGLLAER